MRQEIQYGEFIKKAETLADRWESIVKDLNTSHGGPEYPQGPAAIDPAIVRSIRIISAMHVLYRYYTVLPSD